MELKSLIDKLHSLERKLLPFLEKYKEFDEIVKHSGMQEVEVMRALQWLENKVIVKIETNESKIITLSEKAKAYSILPERIVLKNLNEKEIGLEDLKNKTKLSDAEINISIGLLKKRMAIEIVKDNNIKIKINENGKRLIEKSTPEEDLFYKLLKINLNADNLEDSEKFAFNELKNRGLVNVETRKIRKVNLTDLGKELIKQKIETNIIEALTPEILKNKEWQKKKFRAYDIKINVPKIYGGRRHPLNEAMSDIRKIFMNMGFKEMEGPLVETAFWCMDSMWIPQDHPAREMQDTFYLPYEGKIPLDIAKKVAIVHENGGKSGSNGYGYKWDAKIAKQLLLRTHTTATTFRYFGEKKIKPPAKYFYIGRIFRNEAIDATHLPEFHQSEGFVMEEGLTMRDLMGYIKEFYNAMGIYKIKFKPTYNPYTEPSLECIGYNEQLGKWVELINSGIFRPEALEPYGIKVPVLGWGLGVERLAMMLHQQKDIRNMLLQLI